MKKFIPIPCLILCAALAALINHHAPTVFVDMQLMLGGSVAVFALLHFGWPGLIVGPAALTVTAMRWGHPIELIIGTLFLLALKLFVDHPNGGRKHQDNGRVVLAAIGFWIVIGIPLELLLFSIYFDLAWDQSIVIALKEASTGIINTTIGLLLYLALGIRSIQRGFTTIPVRGTVFVVVLLTITIPNIFISLINTQQLQAATLEAYRAKLQEQAYALVMRKSAITPHTPGEEIEFRMVNADGHERSSHPELMRQLDGQYEKLTTNRGRTPGLDLYVPRQTLPIMEGDLQSYWSVTVDQLDPGEGYPRSITLYQPAPVLFHLLNETLLRPAFAYLFGLLVLGGLLSEWLSSLVDRQFKRVLDSTGDAMLGSSSIRELNQLTGLINVRDIRLKELNDALAKTRQTAYDLTENIPVGTYTMVQPPNGGVAYFSFMSTRFLELTGLEREEARSDPMKAFACVHPEDRDEWVRKNVEVFEKKLPFHEECRIIVRGQIRWIIAESRPRDLDDGSVVWEGVLADITDRKIAEQHLANSEAQLRKILDSIPIGITLSTLEEKPRITFLNENFIRTFGYTLDDIPQMEDFARLACPDEEYREKVFAAWNADVAEATRESGRITAGEYRVFTKYGTYLDVVISAVVKEKTLLAAVVNVTDLRKAERDLADLRQRLEKTAYELTENIPVGTYVLEARPDSPAFTFCSDRWLQMLDLKREEVLADPGLAFLRIREDHREAFMALNAEAISGGKSFKWEGPIFVKNQTRWVNIESRPRTSATGRMIWEGVMIDITDRKNAEQARAEANMSIRLAAQATRLGFWDYAVATGLDRWDENMCLIHGLKPGEFDGDWKKFIHPDDYDEVMRQTQQMLNSDAIFAMDYRIVRADGQTRHIREHGMVIRDKQGKALRAHGTMSDITDEVMAAQRERDLETSHRRNLESKLKSSLAAAAIGHEINTPLSTLLLQTKQAIKSGRANLDELNIIAGEAQQVLRIIDKMKVLMRNVQTEHHAVHLREVIDSSLIQVKRLLENNETHVVVRADPRGRFVIAGDDAQIQLALTNILRNAIEAMNGNKPDTAREIIVELTENEHEVRVVVGDSGPGWPGPGHEEWTLHTTKEKGTGIGLYIVRTTIQNHHAKISFGASALGGAEIALIFPALREVA